MYSYIKFIEYQTEFINALESLRLFWSGTQHKGNQFEKLLRISLKEVEGCHLENLLEDSRKLLLWVDISNLCKPSPSLQTSKRLISDAKRQVKGTIMPKSLFYQPFIFVAIY